MTDRCEKPNRMVRFTATEADQRLLSAIDRTLETQVDGSFSDLCKQALQHYLSLRDIPPGDVPQSYSGWIVLQQQVITMQLQLTHFAQQQQAASEPLISVKQQIQALGDRLTQLEQQVESGVSTPPSIAEVDPLLSRLAPLLEDF
ncbi:MAG TPA: hypothetical protein V6D10_07505 [Trichocoleus sp.]|jgi:hypothetical protein